MQCAHCLLTCHNKVRKQVFDRYRNVHPRKIGTNGQLSAYLPDDLVIRTIHAMPKNVKVALPT